MAARGNCRVPQRENWRANEKDYSQYVDAFAFRASAQVIRSSSIGKKRGGRPRIVDQTESRVRPEIQIKISCKLPRSCKLPLKADALAPV